MIPSVAKVNITREPPGRNHASGLRYSDKGFRYLKIFLRTVIVIFVTKALQVFESEEGGVQIREIYETGVVETINISEPRSVGEGYPTVGSSVVTVRDDPEAEVDVGRNLAGINSVARLQATVIREGNIRENDSEVGRGTNKIGVGLVVEKVAELVAVSSAFRYKGKVDITAL
jgi:hypothetical protein